MKAKDDILKNTGINEAFGDYNKMINSDEYKSSQRKPEKKESCKFEEWVKEQIQETHWKGSQGHTIESKKIHDHDMEIKRTMLEEILKKHKELCKA